MANFFTKSIQFFYCKYEAHVVPVNIISSKFFILQPSENLKTIKPDREEPVLNFTFTQLHVLSYYKTSWQNEARFSPIFLMLHDFITSDIIMTLLG